MLKRKATASGEETLPTKRSQSSLVQLDISVDDDGKNCSKSPILDGHNPKNIITESNDSGERERVLFGLDYSLKSGKMLDRDSEEEVNETASTRSLRSDKAYDSDNNSDNGKLSSCLSHDDDDDDNDGDDDEDDDSNPGGSPGESKWLPIAGPMSWVQKQMRDGKDPRTILSQLLPSNTDIPEGVHDVMLWKIIVSLLSEPPKRKKLETYNTLDDLLQLISTCTKIIVLTGAGVSVSCGIPDFRSRDGLYARLAQEYPDLPDPQAMFDIDYFRRNPNPFFKFAKEIYPGKFEPSPSHKFIKLLESKGKLLRNYTQNIDTLEQVAGITNVVQCHGSFATATCLSCKKKFSCDEIKEEIMNQQIPRCKTCASATSSDLAPIIKPDIVFFGESLPDEFHEQIASDKTECDLLIVMGSSLKVRPVSLIPNSLPPHVPQVIINRERLSHQTFDIELLGDCDIIVQELVRQLKWGSLTSATPPTLKQIGMEQLKPAGSTGPDMRYTLRLPDISTDQSVCSTETSDVSSFNLNLKSDDYLNPLDGSQLSVICHLKVNTNTADHASQVTENMSVDQPFLGKSYSMPVSPLVSGESAAGLSSQEHSFTGKIGREKRGSIFMLPPGASDIKQPLSKTNLSTQLPVNSYLFMEPSRYVFSGAEYVSDDDEDDDDDYSISDSNEDDDNVNDDDDNSSKGSEIMALSNVEEPSDYCPSDADMAPSEAEQYDHDLKPVAGKSSKGTPKKSSLRLDFDENAFDAFPDNTSSSSTTVGNLGESPGHSHSANSQSHSHTLPFITENE